MMPIAVVGIGKIARDQHLPAIARSADFDLAGAVSLDRVDLGVPCAATIRDLRERVPAIAAVAICTPPLGRLALVREALDLGLHVMIEKPPAATLSEAEGMAGLAAAARRTLFAAWHSREAAGVEPARAWLATREVRSVRVEWLEDVRVWHPGQEWIWEPGIGVLDPGINALSILTLLFGPLAVERAELRFPANRAAPIGARLDVTTAVGVAVSANFAFDHPGDPAWSITVATDDGELVLADGGARLTIDGLPQALAASGEYDRLYGRFAALVQAGGTDVDLSPFRLVADTFLLARRIEGEPFDW